MTYLTLVRHGETDWNRAGRIQGSTDIPLNATGRAQAQRVAERLRTVLPASAPVFVAASDLVRASDTARIIASELGAPAPVLYPDFRERGYGEAEGVGRDEFLRRWGEWHSARVPGAEDPALVRERAIRGLRQATARVRLETAPTAASLIVVAHGALIRALVGHATRGELPEPGTRIPNGAHYELLVERERLRLLSGPTALD